MYGPAVRRIADIAGDDCFSSVARRQRWHQLGAQLAERSGDEDPVHGLCVLLLAFTPSVYRWSMRIHLVSVSARVPAWVSAGYEQYATRLRGEVSLQIHEVALARRGRGDSAASLMRDEARRIATALPTGTHRVALEATGSQWSTEQLREDRKSVVEGERARVGGGRHSGGKERRGGRRRHA